LRFEKLCIYSVARNRRLFQRELSKKSIVPGGIIEKVDRGSVGVDYKKIFSKKLKNIKKVYKNACNMFLYVL
jgi:hypothetical protein